MCGLCTTKAFQREVRSSQTSGSQYAGTPPHCSCHFNSQLLMTNGVAWWGSLPHCSCHFNSQLLKTNGVGGWGSSSSSLMSLQLSTPNDQWGWVGEWGPPHWSCHFNSQLLMTNGLGGWCPPPHCSCHQPSWLQDSSEMKMTSITVCQHSLS